MVKKKTKSVERVKKKKVEEKPIIENIIIIIGNIISGILFLTING